MGTVSRIQSAHRLQYPDNTKRRGPLFMSLFRQHIIRRTALQTPWGKPMVLVSTMIACWSSAGFAPHQALCARGNTQAFGANGDRRVSWTSSKVFLFRACRLGRLSERFERCHDAFVPLRDAGVLFGYFGMGPSWR